MSELSKGFYGVIADNFLRLSLISSSHVAAELAVNGILTHLYMGAIDRSLDSLQDLDVNDNPGRYEHCP